MSYTKEIIRHEYAASERYVPYKITKDIVILFIHSSGHGSWMWKNFLSYFAVRGYDSRALNLRGHYLSGQVEDWSKVGLAEYIFDIDEAVRSVGDNVFLVGHSMSGLLVLKYAEANDVEGLIVSQSGPPLNIREKHGINFRRPVPRQSMGSSVHPAMKDREKIMKVLFDEGNVEKEAVELVIDNIGEESARATEEIMNLEVDPGEISAPLYVLGFDTKKILMKIDVDINRILAEEFNALDYQIIEPGGHNYMLEKNWQIFAQLFERWIEMS
ncbi:alpha/beta hydrolase [Spirochaetota bacterium]